MIVENAESANPTKERRHPTSGHCNDTQVGAEKFVDNQTESEVPPGTEKPVSSWMSNQVLEL